MSGPVAITEKVSGFNPKAVEGLQLWLDASDTTTITQDGSANVSQWRDKSINGYQALQNTAQGRDKPTFVTGAQNYVSLAPNQALVIPNFPLNTAWSVFSCMNNVTLAPRWYISPYDDAQIVLMGMSQGTAKIFNTFNFSGLVNQGVNDSAGPHIEYTTAENTNGTAAYLYYRDGILLSSNNSENYQGSTNVRMGIGANGASGYDADGTYYIYEVLIYNRFLSDLDRQKVESYLAQKWSMTANLDPNHLVVSLGTSLYSGVIKATERMFDLKSAGRCA